MKSQIKELDHKLYDIDSICNSCDNPLPLFDTIVIKIGNNKYKSPLCISCLNKKGISYE